MEKIPWYQSAIVRQQIVQFSAALIGLLGWSQFADFNIDQTVGLILGGIGAVTAVWTVVTRVLKPAPNLSQTAANKEVELKAAGKFVEPPPAAAPPAQSAQTGFARVPMLASLFAATALFAGVLTMGALTGCTGTQAAYKTAAHSEAALADTAYVVAEHYAALVHEAANLAALPTTDRAVVDAMKAADAAVKPWILGDPAAGKPGLRDLAQRYQDVKSAATAADLQRAIDGAVLELAKMINAVKAARRQ